MKVDFKREKRWWNAKAPIEENDLADEPINRALRWREIERHLDGVKNILCVGGGTGAFSIPLARSGFNVTHVDFSPKMLQIAGQNASDVSGISFVEANAVELSEFPDRSFDLVLNMDGAVSFCGSEAERAIAESCRITRKTVIFAVSNRAWCIPVWFASSIAAMQRSAPCDYEMFDRGTWHQDQFEENAVLAKASGCTNGYFGAFRAFFPKELRSLLEEAGMQVMRCSALGSLSNLCGKATVEEVLKNEQRFEEFVALAERFDAEVLPDGPGSRQRAGLIAVATRPT